MLHRIVLPAAAVMLAFAACTKDLDLETQRPAPSVVLNCVATPDDSLRVSVSRTRFFRESQEQNLFIADAKVQLTLNGAPPVTLRRHPSQPHYVADLKPQPGDRIRIDVTTSYGNAWAEDVVPTPIPIDEAYTTRRPAKDVFPTQHSDVYDYTYHITLTDPPGQKNYYFLRIVDPRDNIHIHDLDYTQDEAFLLSRGGLNLLEEEYIIDGSQGVAFTDDVFNGKTYTLRVGEKSVYARSEIYSTWQEPRRIVLYAISESYYRYLSGIFNESEDSFNSSLVQAGLAEPSPHFSNINGGTGILGTMKADKTSIDLRDFRP